MIEGIVKKIMNNGIDKYAEAYKVPSNRVQIKVTNNQNGTVFYSMCKDFKEVENVSFLQIMGKKMDIFQYELLASPFLKKSLHLYSKETNDDIENVCSFIMQIKDKNIGISFYNGYKNGKNITLKKYLEELGI